jgi:hypothetical protein
MADERRFPTQSRRRSACQAIQEPDIQHRWTLVALYITN